MTVTEYYKAALFFVTLLICILIAAAAYAQEPSDWKQRRTLLPQKITQPIRAIDGDTIEIGNESIRILGIDTPEITPTQVAKCEDPMDSRAVLWQGWAAQGRLQTLMNRKGVVIQREPTLDRFGRTLATVKVGKEDVAKTLISEQLAVPYVCAGRCPARKNWCPQRARPTSG